MNGKFDKKAMLKKVNEGEKFANKALEDSVIRALRMLRSQLNPQLGTFPMAVVELAETLYKIKMQSEQTRQQIDALEMQLKMKGKCGKCEHGKTQKVGDPRRKTPVS